MKKIKILAIATLLSGLSYAQTFPIGAPPAPFTLPNQAASAWYRGGNFPVGATPPTSNIFGTATSFNASIHTITNGVLRTKLNGSFTYNVNGFVAARDGYLWLGPDAPVAGGPGTYYNNKGAFSLLHLNGTTSALAIELGYRPWMKTGITFTENSDLMYVGRKSEGTGPSTIDQTDAIIAWADDGSGPPFSGPDNMRFIFTFGNAAGTSAPNGDLTGGGMDGREVMRMTAIGNVGVGPRFDNSFQPQSTYHQHQENNLSSWMQVTNQMITTGVPSSTGPTFIGPNDGFRWGILGAPTALENGNAFIYNQEQRHIIFSTGVPTPTNMTATLERVRITALENPTVLPTGGYGVYNPTTLPLNTTRVAISENPIFAIQRPMSLLHLGYDVGFLSPPASVGGWRPWMDIGTYTQALSDNMYVGMKRENPGSTFDRSDAVVNWGDNQTGTPATGPDNLRFIFTQNTSVPGGSSPATLIDGLETGRFFPGRDTLGTFGRFGVGDFTATGVGGDPTHKIDVVGNGRFRFLPDSIYRKDSSVLKMVFVDTLGVLRWEYADSLNLGQGGNACGAATTNPLTSNWELPMGDFNYHFSDAGSTNPFNNVGIGTNCNALNAKLVVANTVMQFGINAVTNSGNFSTNYAIRGNAINTFSGSLEAIGVDGNALNAGPTWNVGVNGNARSAVQTNYGGRFTGSGLNTTNMGAQVFGGGSGAISQNYGLNANASGGAVTFGVRANATSALINFGGNFTSTSVGASTNYGIYSEASGGTTNYAGYFNGDVIRTGTDNFTSDINLKQNIDSISNALGIINQLNPKTFNFDTIAYPQMNLSNKKQYGLIAQEVETVLPELVSEAIHPAVTDTLGVIITPSVSYKTLNYNAFIAILMKGIQEQQAKIDSLKDENNMQDSINTSLQNQIDQLAALINSCCNSHSMQQNNNSSNSIASEDVNLKDGQAIVLEQNVPNPFAEQTTINYFLPDNVVKAQILFYNAQGKLIQSVDLNEKGKGSLNVFASDLSNGIYTYTLVVDGKIVETKKMLKQQ